MRVRCPARLVAVHVAEQLAVAGTVQLHLDFGRMFLGHLRGPLRRQPGVHHHPAQFAVHVHQLLQAQPVQQFIAVLGLHDAQQVRVDLALLLFGARTDGQQRKIMVAQHHHAVLAQRVHQPQRFQ
ncbi:hypothetical protein G6F68_017125 [Rhizopus microsporus]|nr:hypothetical protein G6F68_017125 [Rhizopus microsporus]